MVFLFICTKTVFFYLLCRDIDLIFTGQYTIMKSKILAPLYSHSKVKPIFRCFEKENIAGFMGFVVDVCKLQGFIDIT